MAKLVSIQAAGKFALIFKGYKVGLNMQNHNLDGFPDENSYQKLHIYFQDRFCYTKNKKEFLCWNILDAHVTPITIEKEAHEYVF